MDWRTAWRPCGILPWKSWAKGRPFLTRAASNLPLDGRRSRLAVTARNAALRDFTLGHVKARQDRGKHGQGHNDLLSKLFEIHEAKSDEFDETDVVSMAATYAVATRCESHSA